MLSFKTLGLASLSLSLTALATRVGYGGEIEQLEGGLEGTITVASERFLVVTGYTLEDGGAPALYWWGAAEGQDLVDGFRIASEQVDENADDETYIIELDNGYNITDFVQVGLWCERFNSNFGAAMLTEDGGDEAALEVELLAEDGEDGEGQDGDEDEPDAAAGVSVSMGLAGALAAAAILMSTMA